MLDELSLRWKINGTVDHLPDPHHGVGVTSSGQDTLQGRGELCASIHQAKLLARLGDGAQEHVVPGQPLDGLDQHGVHPQLQLVAELVGGEELDVLIDNDGAPAVVDTVSAILPGQSCLLTLKQLPATFLD